MFARNASVTGMGRDATAWGVTPREERPQAGAGLTTVV